jgi:ribosomal protein S18 acetylase RimI-like enzyme
VGSIVDVRPAGAKDLDALVDFNLAMAQETESKRLDPARLARGVQTLLQRPSEGRYLVAEAPAAGIVGALMLTFEWSDWRNGRFWWIQSVYVRPDWRRRQVYRALHERVRAEAFADPEACGLRLYVERENGAAQAVYRAMRMIETPYLLFEEDFDRTS